MDINELKNLKETLANTIILRTLDALEMQHPDNIVICKKENKYHLIDLINQAEIEMNSYSVSHSQVNFLSEVDIKEIMDKARKEFEVVIDRLNKN